MLFRARFPSGRQGSARPKAASLSERALPRLVRLTLLVLFWAFVVSCDEVERHKVLTLFFDGVPPLGQAEHQQESVDLASKWFAKRVSRSDWYIHEPLNNCATCHGERKQRSFSRSSLLTSPLPELCYNCHTNYTVSSPFIHGPVAVGQCLFCHNPHKSKIEHLLKEPEPKVCYQCHDKNVIESIPGHSTELSSGCTNCHSAHASSTKYLLKPVSSKTNEELDRASSIDEVVQNYIQAGKEQYEKEGFELKDMTPTAVIESKRLFQALWIVSELIEQGELKKAKAHLEKIKESNAFTQKERAKIAQVLRLMSEAETHPKRIKQIGSGPQKLEQMGIEPKKTDSQQSLQKREIAELYCHSIELYRAGQLEKAREGFVKVLQSDLVPEPMAKTIEGYLVHINNTLAGRAKSPGIENLE